MTQRSGLAVTTGVCVPLALVIALLSGCTAPNEGGQPTSTSPSTSSSALPTGASAPTGGAATSSTTAPPQTASALSSDPVSGTKVEVDAQDRVRKQLGQAGTLTEKQGNAAAFTISVSSPAVLDHCTMRGFGDRLTPEHGTFVRIHVKASLSKTSPDRNVDLMSTSFVPVDAQGQPLAQNAWSQAAEGCEVKDNLDIMVLAGESAEGNLLLDVPTGTVAIAFDPGGAKGWSWPLK